MTRVRQCLAALALVASLRPSQGLAGPSAEPAPSKVHPLVWDATRAGGEAEMLVVLPWQADLTPAAAIRDVVARRTFVRDSLRAVAATTQGALLADLAQRGAPARPRFIVNLVWTRGDRELVRALARRDDVARIEPNPRLRADLPDPLTDPPPGSARPKALLAEWGVDRVGAPAAWAQGADGAGLVVGGQDTGVRWTHEALRDHYRGWDGAAATHDYNWHDAIHAGSGNPCGTDAAEPCDDHGHGTHTVGTTAGGTATDAIGVAPAARWIACRNMDRGVGAPDTYLECFEFFLAPWPVGGTPAEGRPDLAPDVTINSWACPPSEGCTWDVLQAAVDAQRAAGIMTVVAAGNSGPACDTVDAPPSMYDGAYTVGASNASDGMAGFSSRGPGLGTGLVKPDVAAPGVGVRSATAASDASYGSWSGTSMATPHVSGVVAALWSGRPAYRGRIAETEELLNRTALRLPALVESCGGDYVAGPNGTWGHGRVSLAAALAAACLPPVETRCDDGFDSDCDGRLDCADLDCAGDPACPEAGNCADGLDNDLDAAADCGDPECVGDAACPEAGHCNDALDNDLDGAADCLDSECAGDPACPEWLHCADGQDNDLDGLADCEDADCFGPSCPEAGRCADGLDQDRDGRADCADDDCAGDPGCPEAGNCGDDVDNDRDGVTDCDDPECAGVPWCPEAFRCSDGLDNDGDGLTDCADPECDGDAACPEAARCRDGRDNDLDGELDCDDAECVFRSECAGADRDGDGVPNGLDCRVLDDSAWGLPPEVTGLRVTKEPGGAARLAWDDVRAASGTATGYDVASGRLSALAPGATGACLAWGAGATTLADPRPAPRDGWWYLVRARNACGAGPGAACP